MIVVVGSKQLWALPETASAIAGVLATTPGEIGIRTNIRGEIASDTERLAAVIADRFGRGVRPFAPETTNGRAAVYERDYRMVEAAEKVIAFFAPEQEMSGGTGHVVKAALDRGIEVEAYAIDEEGHMSLIGSDDGIRSDHGKLGTMLEGYIR